MKLEQLREAAIMGTVRKYNRLSGTVTASGVDFTNSATGG